MVSLRVTKRLKPSTMRRMLRDFNISEELVASYTTRMLREVVTEQLCYETDDEDDE